MNARFEHNKKNYEFQLQLEKRPEDNLIGPPLHTWFTDLETSEQFDLTLAGIQERAAYYAVTGVTKIVSR